MRILVDMDGVIADFDRGISDNYRILYPEKSFESFQNRHKFKIEEQFPPEIAKEVRDITLAKGFYINLRPIDGSLDAVKEIESMGNQVYICTTPLLSNPYCVNEKFQWVKKYLGWNWTKKVIMVMDKTIIPGDILIDDKPEVKGDVKPTWEHILYTQPYNMNVQSQRRLTWENWRTVLNL